QVAHFLKTGEKLPDPTLEVQLNVVLNHYDEIIEHYGEDIGMKIARKHLGWYSSGLPNSGEFRATINQLSNVDEVKDTVKQFYGPLI
ncbi:MAG: tRNA-dihydrouridine synthase, partial [Rickettsiaceae bacterium]|nr:tRNA-dihydrouridine synthase [Rickettsiaceae bacterium]